MGLLLRCSLVNSKMNPNMMGKYSGFLLIIKHNIEHMAYGSEMNYPNERGIPVYPIFTTSIANGDYD